MNFVKPMMLQKPSLSFYTNIPTPYQLSFFRELANHFSLRVVFYANSESDRSWTFSFDDEAYEVIILKDNVVAKVFQRWIFDFHFSWEIFPVVLKDRSQNVIVGGSYWIPNAIVILLSSKLKSKKVAYFSEPLFEVKGKLKYLIKRMCLRILNLCCNAILCVGERAAISFGRHGVTPPKFVVPYNIDADAFVDLSLAKVAAYRAKYKPVNETVILSSGALTHRKGMDILIKAFKKIKHANLRLLIIGEGGQREELLKLCENDPRIELAGFQEPDELPYYFSIADIFAFASRYDGWAVVINEAIAANVPIISSDKVGAAVEMISSPDLGIICQSEHVEEFKDAMELLATDSQRRDAIKRNALSMIPFISSNFNAQQVYEIFQSRI